MKPSRPVEAGETAGEGPGLGLGVDGKGSARGFWLEGFGAKELEALGTGGGGGGQSAAKAAGGVSVAAAGTWDI